MHSDSVWCSNCRKMRSRDRGLPHMAVAQSPEQAVVETAQQPCTICKKLFDNLAYRIADLGRMNPSLSGLEAIYMRRTPWNSLLFLVVVLFAAIWCAHFGWRVGRAVRQGPVAAWVDAVEQQLGGENGGSTDRGSVSEGRSARRRTGHLGRMYDRVPRTIEVALVGALLFLVCGVVVA